MSDIIKLLLQAEVNKSSIENIKSQLDGLQKNIKPIKIDIQTNSNQTQSTLNKIKETQQQLSSLKSKPMQLIDVQELQKSGAEFERYYKSLDNTMNKISNSYKNMGRVTIEGQKFDEVTKEVNKFTVKVEEAEGIVKKYTYTLKQLLETDGQSHGKGSLAFVLEDIKGLDKSAEVAEKNLKQMHDVRTKLSQEEVKAQNDVDNAIQKTIQSRERENKLLEERQSLAVNRGKDEVYKQQIKDEQDLLKFKREARALVDAEDKKLEEQRLATTTNTQARIERAITGSNETISQQQARMNRANAHDYEEFWKKAIKTKETNEIQSAQKLEEVTKKTLSLDLDKLSKRYSGIVKKDDVANIQSMISALKFDDPNLGHNIDLIKLKMKEVSTGAEQSKKSLDLANKSSMSFGEAMKTAAYKFGIWSAITASYYKVIREISTGIKFITEMDSALTEIGMVTNQTREQTAGLAKEYNNLAKEMKVLTSDLTSSAVEFYRQGLSQEEVMERMRVSTMYSKIANLEFATSAEVLTATVNSMV